MIQKSTKDKGATAGHEGFGTFKGVFTPSILTILGVIMYLRMGWVVGHVGLFGTFLIVSMASTVTFLTGLSISATATNMKVGGGGAYYMISRSLGVEAGAAIGLPLYLAQALGISFYLAGFAESLHTLFPSVPILAASLVSLVLLTVMAYISADFALKIQYIVLTIIALSILSFVFGSPLEVQTVAEPLPSDKQTFWGVFAVFFPAVTGILAGVSMSGDLKDTYRSLPIGTLAAVAVGFVVYLIIPFVLWKWVPLEMLKTDPMVMEKVAAIPQLIILGIWGATLSSALGSLLGAPRTLQALARDGVLPRILGRGFSEADTPRIATGVTFVVAAVGALLGDLNAIAPVLSMFFLTAYGVINLSAGVEGLIGSPAWRPTFRTPWPLSMLGAFACFATMFMINSGATFIALALSGGVFYLMERRNLQARWGDMRRGILMLFARFSIYRLSESAPDHKSWRPYILVLSGSPQSRWYLIALADAISQGKGFLSVLTVVKDSITVERRLSIKSSIAEYLKKNKVEALVEAHHNDDVYEGCLQFIDIYGMGSLAPNTIMMGVTEQEDNFVDFARFIMKVSAMKRNVVVFRDSKTNSFLENRTRQPRIDVWWGRERQNAGLMLAFGFLLRQSPAWRGTALTLKTIARSDEEQTKANDLLVKYLEEGRIVADAEALICPPETEVFERIRQSSENSDLVFIGLRPPKQDESVESYAEYYKSVLERTKDFPPTAVVLAAEGVKYNKIFS